MSKRVVVKNTPVCGGIFLHPPDDVQDKKNKIADARAKIVSDLARARRLRTEGEYSKEDWEAEKKRLEGEDAYLKEDERQLESAGEPKYFSLMDEEMTMDYERTQFIAAGIDYFSDEEWFQHCDSWDVQVEILEKADTPLRAVVRMISDLVGSTGPFTTLSNGPCARPRCSKEIVNG